MTRPSHLRVLLTGANRGIGRSVAELLVARGARVAAVGRDRSRLDELVGLGPEQVSTIVADLSVPKERDGILAQAIDAMGAVDALIQCAGVVRYADVGDIAEDDVSLQLAVNFVAPLMLTQAVASHMKLRGDGGSIVHVASTLGLRPAAGTAVYAASKAALINVTRTLAAELAPHGIRVNAVAPGVVDTDMIRVPRIKAGEPAPDAAEREARVDEQLEALRQLHPLGRLGTAEDVARAVLHLLDAPWTTGTIHVVDGGLLAT